MNKKKTTKAPKPQTPKLKYLLKLLQLLQRKNNTARIELADAAQTVRELEQTLTKTIEYIKSIR